MKRDCRHRRKICTYVRVLQLQRKEVWVKWKIWEKNWEPSYTSRTWDIFPGLINAPARVHFTLFYSDGHVIKTRLRSCDVRYFRWRFVNSCLHNIVYDVTYRHYYNNDILYSIYTYNYILHYDVRILNNKFTILLYHIRNNYTIIIINISSRYR